MASSHPDLDPASGPGPSDPRCLLSPDHSNYCLKAIFFTVTYLRLARHGNCGAFGHGLRGEAVDGEGQCGAAAATKVEKELG